MYMYKFHVQTKYAYPFFCSLNTCTDVGPLNACFSVIYGTIIKYMYNSTIQFTPLFKLPKSCSSYINGKINKRQNFAILNNLFTQTSVKFEHCNLYE